MAGRKKSPDKTSPPLAAVEQQSPDNPTARKDITGGEQANRQTAKAKAGSKKKAVKPKSSAGKVEKTQSTRGDSTAKSTGTPDRTPQRQANKPTVDAARFPVVGLGASAGGLEAVEEFIRAMPIDSGMAFVVVMHQAARQVSLLPELLNKCTKMKVLAIRDGMTVEQDRVYIVPPGKNADLLDGTLHLTNLPEKHAAPLPIDYFFRSLAAERREMAVAIVLSGTGTDGTVGLSAIKGESGMVMVQSVESAKFSGMPEHAINAGWADYVLPPDEMPAQLSAYTRGPFLKLAPSARKPTPAIQQELPRILLKLRRVCGHDFSGYKSSTICRRIERRMNIHQIDHPQQYLKYLDQHEPEAETLFRELLIGVTSFFRDAMAFKALTTQAIMPLLRDKPDDGQIRVWVPACATGEEAYSIAIVLRECMDELKIQLNVQIFATDLNSAAIETARSGRFPGGIGTDVSARRLGSFFVREDDGYRIRKDLRDWLIFAPQNVIHDPPFTKLDLISCRNLLIYMQPELQKKLLALFHYSLNRNGCMFLGTSETISEFSDLFQTLHSKAKVFRRSNAPPGADQTVRFPVAGLPTVVESQPSVATRQPAFIPMRDSISKMLAGSFAPPTVVVRESGEIVHVHGRTGRFLELAPGDSPHNVLNMAREGLQPDLSAALREAAGQDQPVVHDNIAVRTNGDTELIRLIVARINEPTYQRGLLRISFVTIPHVAVVDPEQQPSKPATRRSASSREKELERELQQSRKSVQRTIEELDASNEEMKSTNEELQSTNEELQSTNEELETSKEELQSLNEELHTVNAELQDKIRELSISNDDMNNLLNSTDIATLFLDSNLCIKRFTEQAKNIVRVIPTDVGRSLCDLTSRLQYEDLLPDCQSVLKTLVPKEHEVQTEDDRWLLMRIMPYRTSDDRIDGLVMTFVDIDDSRRAREETNAFLENIVATVREPLLVLDGQLRVLYANRSFYEMFQVSQHETVNRLVYQLGNSQWDIPDLRQLLEQILTNSSSFDDYEVVHDFPGIGKHRMLLNARRIAVSTKPNGMILLAIEATKD